MKKILKKTISIFLITVALISAFTLTSCNRSYDEKEIIEVTQKLLKEAEMLNLVYYGSGIEYYDNDEENGYYRQANASHLEKLGFSTIEELKALTEKTFSDEYSSLLYSTILSALTDDASVVSMSRYYQVYDDESGKPEHIMVYSKFSPMMKDKIEYDYGSVKVERSKKERVYAKVNATVTNSDGKSQQTVITVTLVEEEDGWKIDNPTYANYNELRDRYDELNNAK